MRGKKQTFPGGRVRVMREERKGDGLHALGWMVSRVRGASRCIPDIAGTRGRGQLMETEGPRFSEACGDLSEDGVKWWRGPRRSL